MPDGKPAGVRCVQLGADLRCAIFGDPRRPACCSGLQPSESMCGDTRAYALAWLTQLEIDTQPERAQPVEGSSLKFKFRFKSLENFA
jgi:uncharacterized protein